MIQHSELGKKTIYKTRYDKSLLFPIARAVNRVDLQLSGALPFKGYDSWNAYELSWLNSKGKPIVMIAEFIIPCTSPNLIESKSFKLYLNSFNQTRFASPEIVRNIMQTDLSSATGSAVKIIFSSVDKAGALTALPGKCVDSLDIDVSDYFPNPQLLSCHLHQVSETLYSNLLRSNCPVTGQPDWASVMVEYTGQQIDHANLLKYIISFREHTEFGEHCVERIFMDIMRHCQPEKLTVYGSYTRRGGLDINPFRSNHATGLAKSLRLPRQ